MKINQRKKHAGRVRREPDPALLLRDWGVYIPRSECDTAPSVANQGAHCALGARALIEAP